MISRLLMIFLLVLVVALPAYAAETHVRLVVPAELKAAGVLESLLPVYREERGGEVDIIASDDPLAAAGRGEADLVISTLGRDRELELVESGAFDARYDLMGRMFVIVGPSKDPAGIARARTALEAASMIAKKSAPFVSISDQPLSHALELQLWARAGVDVKGMKSYRVDSLAEAMAGKAYAIVEHSYVSGGAAAKVLYEKDPLLTYQYSLLTISKKKLAGTKYRKSMNLLRWLMSAQAQKGIDSFRDSHGVAVFKSNAKPCNCEE